MIDSGHSYDIDLHMSYEQPMADPANQRRRRRQSCLRVIRSAAR